MNIADRLSAVLPRERVLDKPEDLAHYGCDWTRWWTPAPCAVALPESVGEVQELVRWAVANDVPVVPSGGRTGLSGGAVAAHGELVISTERMHRVLDFDAVDRSLVVDAGIVTQTVQEQAREHDLMYPVDFGSRGSSQIGGNVATNAGGIKVIRYGLTRNWVSGLKVVDGHGDVLDLNRGLVKNATGFDLRHLMIGSEGTLGIVVEATLHLTDPPRDPQVMLLAVPDMGAIMQLLTLVRSKLPLTAFEFFTDKALGHVMANGERAPLDERAPYYALVEFERPDAGTEDRALEAFEEAVTRNLATDGVLSQSEAQAAQLWRYRETITESIAKYTPYKNDVSVRVAKVPQFLANMDALFAREYPDWEVVWFGHIGDGNLHISVLKPEAMDKEAFEHGCERVTGLLCDVLERHGGSISAEHGVGLLKRPYLNHVRSAEEIRLMRGIKKVMDPHGIFNPGKLLPPET